MIEGMSILSRRAHHQIAATTVAGLVLDEWYAVNETVEAGAAFVIPDGQGLIISLAEQGCCQLSDAAQQVQFKQNDMLFIKPRTGFEEQIAADTNWSASYLIFHGQFSERFAESFWPNHSSGLRVISNAPSSWRQGTRELIRLSFNQPLDWDWRFLKTLTQLFEDLVHHSSELAQCESLAARAKSTVYRDIQHPWSIDELANRLGTSTSQFAHKFRIEAGVGPGQWIREARLNHARNLLRQGLTISRVAQDMGYANPFNFTRTYKATFGVPPSSEFPKIPKGLH